MFPGTEKGSGVFSGRDSGRSILYGDDNGQTTQLESWDQTRANGRLNPFRPSLRTWQARGKDSRPLFLPFLSATPFLSDREDFDTPAMFN